MPRETTTDRILTALLEVEPRRSHWRRSVLRKMEASAVGEDVESQRRRLAAEEESAGLTLQELATSLTLRPPTVLARLRRMEEEGLVRRVPGNVPRSPRYRPMQAFHARWVDPEAGLFLSWASPLGIDWRHPLVSRVPDRPAQKILLRWFEELEDAVDGQGRERLIAGFYVYGSCARGDAREGSDLDLLALGFDLPKPVVAAMKDVTAAANLWAERPLQLRVATFEEFRGFPRPFRTAFLRDAVTVGFWGDQLLVESRVVRELWFGETKAE